MEDYELIENNVSLHVNNVFNSCATFSKKKDNLALIKQINKAFTFIIFSYHTNKSAI